MDLASPQLHSSQAGKGRGSDGAEKWLCLAGFGGASGGWGGSSLYPRSHGEYVPRVAHEKSETRKVTWFAQSHTSRWGRELGLELQSTLAGSSCPHLNSWPACISAFTWLNRCHSIFKLGMPLSMRLPVQRLPRTVPCPPPNGHHLRYPVGTLEGFRKARVLRAWSCGLLHSQAGGHFLEAWLWPIHTQLKPSRRGSRWPLRATSSSAWGAQAHREWLSCLANPLQTLETGCKRDGAWHVEQLCGLE